MPMTVDLGELTDVVDDLVRSGRYPSRDAVLADAVRALQKREVDRAALLAEIQIGVDDIAAGRIHDLDEVFEELAKRYRDAAA